MRSSGRTALPLMMIEDPASNARPPTGWQLLTDLTVLAPAGEGEAPLAAVLGAARQVTLRPAQLERVRQAFGRAAARATPLPLRLRLWCMGAGTGDGGWGFFLVERQRGATGEAMVYLVDLYLYHERVS